LCTFHRLGPLRGFPRFNPVQHLIGAHALAGLSAHNRALLLGHRFFPSLISAPFRAGLHEAFTFAIVACIAGAGASLDARHFSQVETTGRRDPRGAS